MTCFRTLAACAALIAPAAPGQDIAPKDSERDPLLSALSGDFGDEEGSLLLSGDISARPSSLVPEDDM